jgi:ABC-2 type transport system permease protein
LIRSDEGASAVVNLVVLPMAFLSGSFGPTRDYPDVLQAVADVLPLTYLIRLVQASYLHGTSLFHDLGAVAVVVAWGVAGLVVAVRRFDWQPREK